MRRTYTLLFLLILCAGKTTLSFAQVNTQDSLALVALYNSTNGASWTTNSNWLSGPVSSWYGITLNGNRVSQINLDGNNLNGTIPSSIGNISQLNILSLGNNLLSGSIPTSIGSLSNLNYLVLSINGLTGSIPSSLGNLTNLAGLDLSYNQLSDSIPSSLGNLTNISQFFYLNDNQLTDSIPSSLGNLTNLTDLELGDNQLSGSIPTSFGNLSSLNYLEIYNNDLSGSIPSSLGNLSSNLMELSLYMNQLTGSIPSTFSNLSSLQQLNLDNNQLSGSIPAFLGSLPSLTGLGLSHNQFSGQLPYSLGNGNFSFLSLNNNLLSGPVPTSFINLVNSTTSISNNFFDFDSLETTSATLPPGQLVDSIQLHLTGMVMLSVTAGGTLANDTFHWYRNGVLDTVIVGDSVFLAGQYANYSVAVTNSIVTFNTGLVLYSDTVLAGSNPLLISLLNFSGNLEENNAVLQWQTATEENSSYFTILRSTNGISFTPVGNVNAAGNSTIVQNYQYTDNLSSILNAPVIYYRLQEVDKNGNYIYSGIIAIKLNSQDSYFIIYPNPVKDILNIINEKISGNAIITLFDINGKKLLLQQQSVQPGSNIEINMSQGFAPGIYLLNVSSGTTSIEKKIIKE